MLGWAQQPPSALIVALGAFGGALAGRSTLLIGGVGIGLMAVRAWRLALPMAVAAACSLGAAAAWSGLDATLPSAVVGTARLITDPAQEYGAVRAEAVLGGRHWDLWAYGAEAGTLAALSAGQTVRLEARTSELKGRSVPYLRRRHIAGRLHPELLVAAGDGNLTDRIANWVRRTVDRGASHLPDPARGLFGGMVLGDDRHQDAATIQRFRSAGLSHLLVVSGQNVAFVLALFSPLVARGATGSRLLWTLAVLALFGAIVRWEPSVMRAVAMAGLVTGTRAMGATVSGGTVLCWVVSALLVVDPFLAGSISFLLSVTASAGLAVITPRLAEWLKGPRPIREALGATVGAQMAVAPVLLAVFGAVPLASVPANLLAVPVAGPAMTWGMAAGVPAGVLGEASARWLHIPTRLMVGWVDQVADWASGVPAPVIRAPGRSPVSPMGTQVVSAGGATVVVVKQPRPELADELRGSGVRRIDLLVMTGANPRALRCARSLQEALSVHRTLGPEGLDLPRSTEIRSSGRAQAGPISVDVTPKGERLVVEVSLASGR